MMNIPSSEDPSLVSSDSVSNDSSAAGSSTSDSLRSIGVQFPKRLTSTHNSCPSITSTASTLEYSSTSVETPFYGAGLTLPNDIHEDLWGFRTDILDADYSPAPISANTRFIGRFAEDPQVHTAQSSIISTPSSLGHPLSARPSIPLNQPYQTHVGSTPRLWPVGPKEDAANPYDASFILPPWHPPSTSDSDGEDECHKQNRRPPPGCCGRLLEDWKAHMLIDQNERLEKCPPATYEDHVKSFKNEHDEDRQYLTHYSSRPGPGSAAEKSSNKVRMFRPVTQRKSLASSGARPPTKYGHDATAKCSICFGTFCNAQDFYEHLNARVIQQEEPSQAIIRKGLAEVTIDGAVNHFSERNKSLNSASLRNDGAHIADEDHDNDEFHAHNRDLRFGPSHLESGNSVSPWSPFLIKEPSIHPAVRLQNRNNHTWGVTKKHVLDIYDGQHALWKMLGGNVEARPRLPDCGNDGINRDAYVTNLDIEHKMASSAADDDEDGASVECIVPMDKASTFMSENNANEIDVDELTSWNNGSALEILATAVPDDAESIISDTYIVPERERELCLAEFVEQLSQSIQHHIPEQKMLQRLTKSLPGLINDFALQARINATTRVEWHVADFISKNPRDVVGSIFEKLRAIPGWEFAGAGEMNLNDRMDFRASKNDPASPEVISTRVPRNKDNITEKTIDSGIGLFVTDEELEKTEGSASEEEMRMPDCKPHRSFLADNPAFQTLLVNLNKECLLATQQLNAMEMIKESILKVSPQSFNSSSYCSTDITFVIDWDPRAFILSQKYPEKPEDAIEDAITITGTTTDAQALTCRQYLCQTWPSSGLDILQMIKDIVRSEGSLLRSYAPSNKANITVRYISLKKHLPTVFIVHATGDAHVIAEIGEQLAWLGAALQSPDSDGISSVKPRIRCSYVLRHVYISFDVEKVSLEPSTVNGNCWHNMFRSPVVAEGFSIPLRPQASPSIRGLEIPLNMMAGLAQARRVNKFRSRTILKGHFTMLLPVDQIGDVVMWHLIHDEKGNRIPYNDCLAFDTVDVDLSTLERARHVLGWCSEMKFYGGAADARYGIGASRLPRAQTSDGLLAEAALCHGQRISGGHPFSVGHRDIPIHVSQDGLIPRLKWMSKRYVVLWDTECNRAWLISGTAALLHLVRASLERDKTDPFHSVFLFDASEMTEAPRSHHPHSAIHVLIDQRNLNLKVYPNKDGYITFEHRVEHFYDVLEKLIDNQVHAVDKCGTGDISRAHLVGWDFKDLISSCDPVYPRLAALDQMGKTWVDFSRSIHAIALFGHGFGEIIEPVGAFCPYWAKLPKDRSYLAACVSDLKEIADSYGDPTSMPTQLTHNTVWHHVEQPFKPCVCHSSQDENHSDVTQVLLPQTISCEEFHRSAQIVNLDSPGAVIFGFNNGFKWYWGDTGDPTKQQLKLDDGYRKESSASSTNSDSGLGKSLSSFSSQDKDSRISISPHQDSGDDSIPSSLFKRQKLEGCPPPRPSTYLDEDLSFAFKRYTAGIICALPIEFMAVRTLFDEKHHGSLISRRDPNHYALGRMANHYVVASCLPDGMYGNNSAVDVACNMKRTFPSLEFCLLVGNGAGVPSQQNDIRLGDVVVSKPTGTHPGVVQYDLGKALEKGIFQQHGSLPPPPRHLMCAISELRSDPDLPPMPLDPFLQRIQSGRDQFRYPGPENDKLYASHSVHVSGEKTCKNCNSEHEIKRLPRASIHPRIHYGLIASGNRVMRDAQLRDRLGQRHDILCFEMEAAGIAITFPCLVIRGICDYADSHKNDEWQGYAAASAAAYAKLLLHRVRPSYDSDSDSAGLQTKETEPYQKRQGEVLLSPRKRSLAGNLISHGI